MNLVLALEQLGYENITDFEVRWNGSEHAITTWNHVDPQPDQPTLDAAWTAWQSANPGPSLTDVKLYARYTIDQSAERARLRHITDGAGQAMVYQEKATEAANYISAGYPAATGSPPTYVGYPLLNAEATATGQTAGNVADMVVAQKDAWIAVGAQIEGLRMGGKKSVNDAADESGVESARVAAIAALDAI